MFKALWEKIASLRWAESWWAVGIFYLILTMIMTWPTNLLISERFIGDVQSDFWKHAWGHWWVDQCLQQGMIPLFCSIINAPAGGYLFTADPFNCLCDGLLMRFLPLSIAYNIWVILNIWGGCMAAWALACYFVKERRVCLVAGCIYGLSAYVLAYPVVSGVSETLNTAWIPLYMLFAHRVVDRGWLRDILGAGLFFFLTAFSCWYYGEFMVTYSAVLLFYRWGRYVTDQHLWNWRVRSWRHFEGKFSKLLSSVRQGFVNILPAACRLVVAVAMAAIVISPFAMMFQMVVSDPANIVMPDKAPKRSMLRIKDFMGTDSPWSTNDRGVHGFHNYTNMLGFFLPGKDNATVTVTIDRLTRVHYLGWCALGLAFLGWRRRRNLVWEDRRVFSYWLGVGLFYLILSLGPKATYSDYSSAGFLNPVYFLMYFLFPMFHKVAVPFRFLALSLLSLGILASFGLRELLRGEQDKLKWGVSLAMPLVLLGEIALVSPLPWPLPSASAKIPAIYEMIADEKGDFAIIDYPYERVNTQLIPGEYFYYQTLHRKAIPYRTSGVLSTEVARNPFMEELISAQFGVPSSSAIRQRMREGAERLKSMGFRYLILHEDALGPLMMGYIKRSIDLVLGEPVFFTDGTLVYLIDPLPQADKDKKAPE